jgi:hypothetical protein
MEQEEDREWTGFVLLAGAWRMLPDRWGYNGILAGCGLVWRAMVAFRGYDMERDVKILRQSMYEL